MFHGPTDYFSDNSGTVTAEFIKVNSHPINLQLKRVYQSKQAKTIHLCDEMRTQGIRVPQESKLQA